MKKISIIILACFIITPVFADDVTIPQATTPQIKSWGDFWNWLGQYSQTPEGQRAIQSLGCSFGDPMVQYRCHQNLERQQMIQNGINPNYISPNTQQFNRNKMINCTPDGQGGFNCMEF